MAKVIILGLLTAQAIAFIQVYTSNINLYQTLVTVREAGYLSVPNLNVMPSLKEFGPAFFGGLFFTLTVGAGLSVVSLVLAWMWDRVFEREILPLILIILLWVALLLGVNLNRFSLLNSAYILLIPAVVAFATLRWLPEDSGRDGFWGTAVHLIPFIILSVLWGGAIEENVFINIRDNIMLSNPAGARINQFYYKYTLYPAEIIKPLGQKTIKTCRVEGIEKKHVGRTLEKVLLRYNYLIIGGTTRVDLEVKKEKDVLLLKNRGKEILKTSTKEFFSKSGDMLKEFSQKTDPNGLFRKIIFLSLLIGQPIIIYILFYTMSSLPFAIFLEFKASSIVASVLCLTTGVLLLIPLFQGKAIQITEDALGLVIESGDSREKVAALKMMGRNKLDVGSFPAYKKILQSSNVPERYWLAKAMGTSLKPETYEDLIALLDDTNLNVKCMAYHALSRRRDKRSIKEILKRIETSNHWYEQLYAYNALGVLGWKQRRSKQK
jgi:Ca2+/Na+ antiporter